MKGLPVTSATVLVVIAIVAIALSWLSYQYSSSIADKAIEISSQDIRSNAEIQVHDLSQVLVSKAENVMDNLQIIASTQAVQDLDLARAKDLFQVGQESTDELTDSYFWVGANGKLIWANAFSNQTLYEQYKGGDRSERSYYQQPRDTHEPFISAVIESVDGVPRLYTAYPVLETVDSTTEFRGVVVAATNLDELGLFLKGQLSPKFQSDVSLTDRSGTILYSQVPTLIGKNVLGPETQAMLPDEIRPTFNSIIRDALSGKTGSGDLTYQGNRSTIAFQPVSVNGDDFGTLYMIAPHQLEVSTVGLIEQQTRILFTTIIVIVAASVASGLVILTWNKRLRKTVAQRTEELHESNKSLKTAVEQLKIHDRMQQDFINIAAHELRTPVQPLLGISELVQTAMKEGGKSKVELSAEDVEMLSRNAKRLERLTKNILDVTRIESDRLLLDKEVFDLNDKIKNVIKDIAPQVTNPKIIFTPSEKPMRVNADKTRIFEVVSNLIRNALKFTKQGRIEISLSAHDGMSIVRIKDTGSGIDPEMMQKLFMRFSSKSETGTGLGLYISKSIVDAHDGKMWAENNPDGRGASFYFSLPLTDQ